MQPRPPMVPKTSPCQHGMVSCQCRPALVTRLKWNINLNSATQTCTVQRKTCFHMSNRWRRHAVPGTNQLCTRAQVRTIHLWIVSSWIGPLMCLCYIRGNKRCGLYFRCSLLAKKHYRHFLVAYFLNGLNKETTKMSLSRQAELCARMFPNTEFDTADWSPPMQFLEEQFVADAIFLPFRWITSSSSAFCKSAKYMLSNQWEQLKNYRPA